MKHEQYVDELWAIIKPEGKMEALKARLEILIAKHGDGEDTYCQLMLEMILQVAELNEHLERGIVTYQGGDAEDVEEEEERI